jgi:hypothetical protein
MPEETAPHFSRKIPAMPTTDQHPEKKSQPDGVSGSSATIAWRDDKRGINPPEDAGNSADAALDQIDRLIGRINTSSASSVAVTEPTSAIAAARAALAVTVPLPISVAAPLQETLAAAPPPTAADAECTPPRNSAREDEALQDYMAQFLERVTGKKQGEPESSAAPAPVAGPVVGVETEKSREMKRALESAQNMSLMRELAKESARHALGAHDGQRLSSHTRYSFLGALALFVVSSLLAASFLTGHMPWAWNVALLFMLPALVLTGNFFRLHWKLQKLNGCAGASTTA